MSFVGMSHTELRRYVRQGRRLPKGVICPTCDQNCKDYWRSLNLIIARCTKEMVVLSRFFWEYTADPWPWWIQPGYFSISPPWIHVPTMMLNGPELLETFEADELQTFIEQLRELTNQGGYRTYGHLWNLIREARQKKADGRRSGWWQVTPKAFNWVDGKLELPLQAGMYNRRFLGEWRGVLTSWDVANHTPYDHGRDVLGEE